MIAARAAAYVLGIVAALALIVVESHTVESMMLAGIVLAAVLVIAWSHGVFTREPRPPRPVSPYFDELRNGEMSVNQVRAAMGYPPYEPPPGGEQSWRASQHLFDQDDYSELDRRDGLGTRH